MDNSQRSQCLTRPLGRCKRFALAFGMVVAMGAAGCGKPRSKPAASDLAPGVALVELSGRVTDGNGEPLAGTQVVVRAGSKKGVTVADEAGAFTLPVPAGPVALRFEKAGYATAALEARAPSSGLEVMLYHRVDLRGKVTSGGRAAAGVTVEVMVGPKGARTAVTDGEGRFAVGDLTEARYAIRAARGDERAYVVTKEGATGEVALTLERARRVMVKLLDDRKAAVAGEVDIVEEEGPATPVTSRIAAAGTTLSLLPGRYRVTVRVSDAIAQSVALVVPSAGDERPETATWTVPRAATLVGTCRDERGAPVAEATLRLGAGLGLGLWAGSDGASDPRLEPLGELGVLRGAIPFPPAVVGERPTLVVQKTDAAGHFVVRGVTAGKDVLVVESPELIPARLPFVARPGEETTIDCVLERGEALRVRVVDENERPIGQATVSLPGGATMTVDAGGVAALRVPRLPVEVEVRAPGYAAARKRASSATLDVTLETASDRVTGIVEDERGRIVSGAEVRVGGQRTTSDGGGRFTLSGLGKPPWSFVASHRDFPMTTLRDSDTSVRIVMPFGGGIEGRVQTARGESLPAELKLTLGSEELKVGSDGRFARTGLPTGRSELVAVARGWATVRRPVEILPAEQFGEVTVRDIDLELVRAATLKVRVTDRASRPLANVTVRSGGERATTDDHGEATLRDVAPGTLTVTASTADDSAQQTIEARPGEDLTVDLELP